MKDNRKTGKAVVNKSSITLFVIFCVIAVILIYRLVDIQLVNYEDYQSKTIDQYTKLTTINAKRGTIYDSNMRALAVSATAERIFIDPSEIPNKTVGEYIEGLLENFPDDEVDAKRLEFYAIFPDLTITVAEDIANELSQLLGVDKTRIMEKAAMTHRMDETIKDKVVLEESEPVHQMVQDKYYTRYVYFAETSKRYYPYSTLASNVIGFTGTDGSGLEGLEAYYDKYLTGTPGKIVTAQDGIGQEMSFNYENYTEAINGTNIMLTIDWNVQRVLEKYLLQAYNETGALQRVFGAIMDVETGEILAMSVMPDYDLNDPFTLNSFYQEKLDRLQASEEEKESLRSLYMYEMWKNKGVSELYEPGSTFKAITASMAVEEGLVNDTETFFCPGYMFVEGYGNVSCSALSGHGTQNFRQGMANSCNPVFMTIGLRVGNDNFYKYMQSFGYFESSGIDLPGEAAYLWHSQWANVELAVSAFGQTFKITPIKHLAAICAVANGGYLVTPHLLKATLDENGNIIENYKTTSRRQVISEEASRRVSEYLAYAASTGGSSNAAVEGYSVAAKTGTSEKRDVVYTELGTKAYIASCIGYAPAEDPKVAMIVMIDEPTSEYTSGSMIAAPVVSKVLTEVLPYLGVEPQYSEDELSVLPKPVSNYYMADLEIAKANITSQGFEYRVLGSGNTVVKQVPSSGSNLLAGGTIILYTEENISNTVVVPSVVGMSASLANQWLINNGLNVIFNGTSLTDADGASVVSQSPLPGETVDRGTVINVELRKNNLVDD